MWCLALGRMLYESAKVREDDGEEGKAEKRKTRDGKMNNKSRNDRKANNTVTLVRKRECICFYGTNLM